MVLLTSLLFFSVLSFTISLVSAITCDGAVGTIAAILAPHRAVRAFCSAQYPVPKATLTAFAPTRTIITTVSTTVQSLTLETTTSITTIGTSSVTAYNATETFKTTAGTETDTETLIDTKTVTDTGTTVVTATTYIDQKKKKRDATVTSSSNTGIPTVTIISSTTVYSTTLTTTVFVTINPQANTAISTSTTSSTKQSPYESAYSVLLSAEDALAGRICRCIETPVFSTKTVTPSTTISIIATSISSVVATSINSTIEITTVSLTTVTTIDLQATVTTNATSDVFTTTTETASPTVTQQATTNDECNSVHVSGVTYSNTFTGRGVRTNSSASDSPDRYPPLTNNLNGTLQACAAIQQCVTLARNDPGTYYNIDIHFSLSAQKWICVQYFDYRYFPGFNVEDSDVGRSYAYEYVDD